MKRISLTEVRISDEARKRVDEVLLSGRIGQGPLIREFEERFAEWVGSRYAIAVASGTAADTIALAVLKYLKPEQDEVILPALTFAAQLNAVLYNGLKPVFVDYGETSQGWARKVTSRTLCSFPVHLLGNLQDCARLKGVAKVEDACEAMGTSFEGKKVGTFGDMGTFSFFPSHAMTTGEGGMIVTDDEACAEIARTLRNHGKTSGADFHFDVVGFNGKMTSIEAALGIEALKEVDEAIAKRYANWKYLGGVNEIEHVYKISPHAFPVVLNSKEERDDMMERLTINGIECRNFFSSLPTQESAYAFLGHKLGEFPEAERIGDCGLYVPCHSYLEKEDLDRIKSVIANELKPV